MSKRFLRCACSTICQQPKKQFLGIFVFLSSSASITIPFLEKGRNVFSLTIIALIIMSSWI